MLNKVFQTGSSTVQMMVASGLIIAGASYVATSQLSSKKLDTTVKSKKQFGVLKREISEALIQDETCMATVTRQGPLTESVSLDGVYNSSGTPMYQVGSELYGKKILAMKLEGYQVQPENKLSIQTVRFVLDLDNAQGSPKVLGSTRSRQVIPLKLSTYNNIVSQCSNSLDEEMLTALVAACSALGGSYNPEIGNCNNLHGDSGPMMKFAREQLCGAKDGDCKHPYENKICSGQDVRGKNWDNWVLSGFNQDGSMACECLPVSCPDPATLCEDQDPGTNHCALECPKGTKDCKPKS